MLHAASPGNHVHGWSTPTTTASLQQAAEGVPPKRPPWNTPPGRRRSPCRTVVTVGCPLPRRGLTDTGGAGRPVPRGTIHVASNRSPFACSHHIGLHPSPETVRRCRRPWAARRVHPRALRAVPKARRRPAAAGGTPSAPPQNAEAPLRHSPRSADAILLPLGGPEHHAIPPPTDAAHDENLGSPIPGKACGARCHLVHTVLSTPPQHRRRRP